MKVYERTENGTTTHVSLIEGRDEIEAAQRSGRRDLKSVSGGARGWFIDYRDGRRVKLVMVEVPEALAEPATPVAGESAEAEHVISVLGGEVHEQHQGITEHGAWPQCRTGGQSSAGTRYTKSTAPLSCRNCITNAERRRAYEARQSA